VAGLIAARRPPNPIGWLLLAFSIGIGLSNANYLSAVYGLFVSPTPLAGAGASAWIDNSLWIIALSPLPMVLLLLSQWSSSDTWLALAASLVRLPTAFAAGVAVSIWGKPGQLLLQTGELPTGSAKVFQSAAISSLFLLIFAALAALAVRFRRGTWEERQQIKWVALGTSYLLLSGVVTTALPELLPPLVEEFLSIAGFVSVPVAIAVAILRHRLYDIDRLINRTLVYGALSVSLGGVYLVVVVILQQLLRPMAGQSPLAIAGSTLVTAALFGPVRSRLQSFIDRRFYREKYDAARTVEEFTARLRDDVDLTDLSAHLVQVVQTTMQRRPECLSGLGISSHARGRYRVIVQSENGHHNPRAGPSASPGTSQPATQ